jgi:hypothetical protein
MTPLTAFAIQHLDACISAGEITGNHAAAINEIIRALRENKSVPSSSDSNVSNLSHLTDRVYQIERALRNMHLALEHWLHQELPEYKIK